MPSDDNSLLIARLQTLHDDVGEIKDVLKELSRAVNRLAVVEERQAQINSAIDRAFKSLSELDTRVKALELSQPDSKRTSAWVDRAVMALAGMTAGYIAVKAGLVKP